MSSIGVTNIIQPVLQFGSSAAGGGDYWALASWYVDSNDNAYFSTLTQTTAGHNIYGTMAQTHGTWQINSIDTNTGQNTLLTIATNTSEPFAFVTLEVYSVSNCGEYPTGTDMFYDLAFSPAFTPTWTPVASTGCNEQISVVNATAVEIMF
jgi:hypothetical protein